MDAPPTKSDYEQRKQYLEDLKGLSKDEYREIFRIIKHHHVEFSENSNGIFFDLNTVSTEVFEDLTKFMTLCKTQRTNETTRENELNALRKETNMKST
jgi:hypothetical protein